MLQYNKNIQTLPKWIQKTHCPKVDFHRCHFKGNLGNGVTALLKNGDTGMLIQVSLYNMQYFGTLVSSLSVKSATVPCSARLTHCPIAENRQANSRRIQDL